MLRRMYDWVLGLAASRHAPAALATVSFAESSFFPVPPDVMLAPMVVARPDKAWTYATICTVASVLGGILGYGIGLAFADLAQQWLAMIGHADAKQAFDCEFQRWGAAIILIKGLTPIPYKLVTIAAGLAHFSFVTFIITSVITRGARFFLVAGVIKRFGPTIMPIVEKRLALSGLVLVALLVGGFVLVKMVFHGGACG